MTEPANIAAETPAPAPRDSEKGAADAETFLTIRELQRRLDKLERREWFLWWSVVVVMLLLTTAVVSLSFPELLREANPFAQIQLSQSVRALVGLVLIFNIYTVYQHLQIRRLRGSLAEQMAQLGELEMRAEQFYNLAVQDHLTGLYNRRYADERLAVELRRSQRHGQPLTVVMVDLDGFKLINDRYGHAAGDHVLREFAARLKRAIRSTDLAARIGGDEFMVMLLECPEDKVHIFINRLGTVEVEIQGRKHPLGISTGWATCQKSDKPETLMDRADKSLYARKRDAKAKTSRN
jgi:diguanylate cyclase (GGDEF)-like protein